MKIWNLITDNIKVLFEKQEPFYLYEYCKSCRNAHERRNWGGSLPGQTCKDLECTVTGRIIWENERARMNCEHYKEGRLW